MMYCVAPILYAVKRDRMSASGDVAEAPFNSGKQHPLAFRPLEQGHGLLAESLMEKALSGS